MANISDKSGKGFLVPLLITVIGGIIVGSFVWWLNSEKYDLRYTLSEKIPLRFGASPEEAVQQIEVKNLSKRPVEKIQVKLPPRLTTFDVLKYSQGDNCEHFKNEDVEEFDYPTLPPQGSFSIVFKTPGAGIARNEVHVSHSKGEATYALEAGHSAVAAIALGYFCGFALFFFFSLLAMKSTAIDSLNFTAEYQSERILKKTAPFYINNEKWAQIRGKAVSMLGKRPQEYSDTDLKDLECYKWLIRTKPGYLSDEEWSEVCRFSIERFRSAIGKRVADPWVSENDILKYLRVEKPTYYPPDKWEELRSDLKKNFFSKRAASRYDENLVAKLQDAKPDEIGQVEWDEIQIKLAERLAAKLYDQSLLKDSPLAYLKEQNLGVLPTEIADKMFKNAYRVEINCIQNLSLVENAKVFLKKEKPAWMSDRDYRSFKQTAERTLLNELLHQIVWGTELTQNDLEPLEPELQEQLMKMDKDIRLAKEKNQSDAKKNSEESSQLDADKRTILKQLNVLEGLFKDPTSIDRIEHYDNPFATGNFELLKKVSKALQVAKVA
jgi:hypothetical protein